MTIHISTLFLDLLGSGPTTVISVMVNSSQPLTWLRCQPNNLHIGHEGPLRSRTETSIYIIRLKYIAIASLTLSKHVIPLSTHCSYPTNAYVEEVTTDT